MDYQDWMDLEKHGLGLGDQVEQDFCKGISTAQRKRLDAEKAKIDRMNDLNNLAILAGNSFPQMRRPIR